MITYQIENSLNIIEFKNLLVRSTLGNRRPIEDKERLRKMLKNANLIATARHDGQLIGISRALTDFAFCTYLSDLAVDLDFQSRGIGKELIRLTKSAAPDAKLILLSAPKAVPYYPKIGLMNFKHCFVLDELGNLK